MSTTQQVPELKKLMLMPWNYLTTTFVDLEKYKYLAQRAAAVGATHVDVAGVAEKSYWEQEDPTDPYPNWSNLCNTIFKCVPPKEFGDAVPPDFAERNMQTIQKRCAVLKKLGLKGYFRGNEPFFVHEKVFAAHPEWRGPRVDHPRRSRQERFAMCTDHPEVLNLYRGAIAEFLRKAPLVDTFSFKPNDEGSGYCWSNTLYNNANGPASCRHRNMGERVAGFFRALLDGAKEAGVDAEFFSEANFEPSEVEAIWGAFGKGMGFNGSRPPAGYKGEAGWLSGGGGTRCAYPIIGMPMPLSFLASLGGLLRRPNGTLTLYIDGTSDRPTLDLYFDILARFRKKPVQTLPGRIAFLRDVAEAQVGEKSADALVDMWSRIDDAFGGMPLLGMLWHQRWLVRPLVPFPLELKPEEKDYYRKHQFQANTEEEAADLLAGSGSRIMDGHKHWRTIQGILGNALDNIGGAKGIATDIAGKIKNENLARYYRLVAKRLEILTCFARTCEYTAEFQVLLDRSKGRNGPAEEVPEWTPGDNDRRMIYNCFRAEMDNVSKLIGLLADGLGDLVTTAKDSACEDAFIFGPDLVDQLRKKVKTMRTHWMDFNRIYPRPAR